MDQILDQRSDRTSCAIPASVEEHMSTCEMYLTQCTLNLGYGFKIAMQAFDITRPLVAIGAAGLARRAFDKACRYAMERKTMGAPIAMHQAIQFMLADMATGIEAGRQLTYKAAYEIDCGRKNTMYA
ncbi:hypothetical protein PsorP6_001890 [Peronosclerospora sorghi]|uniref:Uncharacterized protein n=1 Tax=Peronosclerospora sorghi TaxID=230839 RepID=A0ACC0WYR7_9STRA|nr:hypothetical protein PsorP6_001890 [Peronosclerospora sorghi]